jgi:hypothetical protein
VGWHIWHNNSFNPIYRAEQDLHELSNYSDFIKVVRYNNCGGERMALYADNIGSTLYADLSKQSLIDFNHALMGFKEGSYDQIPHTGLSADYVYRETKRALAGVAGTKTHFAMKRLFRRSRLQAERHSSFLESPPMLAVQLPAR